MIKTLKNRDRVDALKNDVRAGGIAWGRYIYLSMLTGLSLFILNFFVGSYLFLKADGLVIKNTYTVSPLYTARIKKVRVSRGQKINAAQPLIEIESATLMQQLAQISTEVANLTNKTAQIKARTQIAKVLLPTAEEHAKQTTKTLNNLQNLKKESALVTTSRLEKAMGDKLRANANFSRLQAESSVFSQELKLIESAQSDAQSALKKLKELYNQGKINAPVSGTIGTQLVSVGDVVQPGTPLLQVYTGKAYILAFLPKNYLFSLRKGQQIRIISGPLKDIGTIEALLPVAGALPKEFQNSFKPSGRQQLVRISFNNDHHPFIISQNVTIKTIWSWQKIKKQIIAKTVSLKKKAENLFKRASNDKLTALKPGILSDES